MPSFTPPTELQSSDDILFGRYSIPVGQSVVKVDGTYRTTPYPWLGEIADLTEGVDYFLGGRTYEVTDAVATALQADGYTTS
jgi:hypothetical protein